MLKEIIPILPFIFTEGKKIVRGIKSQHILLLFINYIHN
jgi:hypothetical protein